MALFDRFHLSQEEAEARLKRALTGDPTRGEIGLVASLSANKLDDVQARLARDPSLGQDLRELVAEHLQKSRARWETRRAWSVTLPLPVWDEYAREARITGRSITECLVSAIKRDYERKKGTLKSGSGGKVKSREQAIAIGLSEARKKGAKEPRKKKS